MTARQRLIDSTVALMRRRGVASASVSDILDGSGVARRTLYLNFPDGKPALVAAATTHAAGMITAGLQARLTESDPASTIRAFTRMWETVLTDSGFNAGCPIAAAALGRTEAPDAADAAAAAFAEWVRLITETNERAGLPPEDARDLATTIIAAIEGAVLMALATRSVDPIRRTGRDLVTLTEVKLAAVQRA